MASPTDNLFPLSPLDIQCHDRTRAQLKTMCATMMRSGEIFPPQVTEIIPGRLYLADLYSATDCATLATLGITHRISVLRQETAVPPGNFAVKQLHITIDDEPSAKLWMHFHTTVAFIDDALKDSPNSKVIVHCRKGVSRSVSIVAAYLMWSLRVEAEEAIELIQSKRPIARPNEGFVRQLEAYGLGFKMNIRGGSAGRA